MKFGNKNRGNIPKKIFFSKKFRYPFADSLGENRLSSSIKHPHHVSIRIKFQQFFFQRRFSNLLSPFEPPLALTCSPYIDDRKPHFLTPIHHSIPQVSVGKFNSDRLNSSGLSAGSVLMVEQNPSLNCPAILLNEHIGHILLDITFST